MTQVTQAAFDARPPFDADSIADAPATSAVSADIKLSVHRELEAVERDWRAFEQHADCMPFQSFGWLAAWQREIGEPAGATPVIVMGRDGRGRLLFIFPLAVERSGSLHKLVWLGSELGDYNAPLLDEKSAHVFDAARFPTLWQNVLTCLQEQGVRFDIVHFEKMPEMVGAQRNPFMALGVKANPSGAYRTTLGTDWETFYAEKRSPETRRNDRRKRKKLVTFGDVNFVTPERTADIERSLAVLMEQKAAQFEAMGVANMFERPGYPAFYRRLATDSVSRDMVHVSRLDVGETLAAVNLGLVFRGCYYHVLASYDGGPQAKFGPGAAHLHELIAYAIERKCSVFDFTIGDERYKRDWCDGELMLFDHVRPVSMRGVMAAGLSLGKRAVKRQIKQTPALWNAFFKLRAMAGSLRGG